MSNTFLKIYVEKHNKGKPIKEIDYGGSYTDGVLTKITYTREEVEKLIDSCWHDSAAKGGLDEDCLTLEQWKEQHL